MAVTSYKFPGTASSQDRDGKVAWTNPSNALSDDDVYASVTLTSATYTDWLRLTNFGFTSSDVPAGSIINGIEVEIQVFAIDNNNTSSFSSVLLRNASAAQVGTSQAPATLWSPANANITFTLGGPTNDWGGAGITQADVVSSNFGLDISIQKNSSGFDTDEVDYAKIRIYYTLPASPPPLNRPRRIFSRRRLR